MKYVINCNNSINKMLKKCQFGDILYLENGIYNEKVEIRVPGVSIIGESKDGVIISNHDFYHKLMDDYNECNTFRTYTVLVLADNVVLENLTIENTSVPSFKYGQAVALSAMGDNFLCNNCILRSAQDTLFTGSLPKNLQTKYKGFHKDELLQDRRVCQEYNNCTIVGDVDFIFGTATCLFNACEIISLERNLGYVCAPAHEEDTLYGYLFYKCNLTSTGNLKNVYLGRPWRDYGKACFIECNYGNHICDLGFNKWDGTNRDKTATFIEYNSKADLSKRAAFAHIINKDEALVYYNNFINFIKRA